MKKLMILALVLGLATTTMADPEPINNGFWYGGGKYDSENGWTVHGGRALHVSGGLYSLPGVEIDFIEGVIGFRTVGVDFIYLWPIQKGFYGGLVAAPAVDWEESPPGDPLAYVTGAAGVVGGWNSGKWGVGGAARYKVGSNGFADGWQVWGGLALAVGD